MITLGVQDILGATVLGKDHTVGDWPWGRRRQCSMHFFVECGKYGERFVKQSTMEGRMYKPKTSTYAGEVLIIEIDGKIGHLEWSPSFEMLSIQMEDSHYMFGTFFDREAKEIYQKLF